MKKLVMVVALALSLAVGLSAGVTRSVAVDYGTLTAQLVDSTTGDPLSGVDVFVYEYDSGSGSATVADGGATDENGMIKAHVRADYAVLYINGLSPDNVQVYRPTFAGGENLTRPLWTQHALPEFADRWRISLSTASGATRYRVAAGKTVSAGQVKVDPTSRTYGFISGKTTEAHSGRGWHMAVRVSRFDEATQRWGEFQTYGWSSGRVDYSDAGCFSIVGTASRPLTGKVKLEFRPDSGARMPVRYFGGTTPESAQVLTLAPGQSAGGIFQATPGLSRVRGMVLDARTGAPVRDANVEAQRWDPIRLTWREAGYARTTSAGTYMLPEAHGMDPGIWRLHMDVSFGEDGLEMWYGQASSVANTVKVTVPPESIVEGIDFVINSTTAICGRAVDESDTPLPDILVTAFRQLADGTLANAGSVYTDASGRYRLPTGTGGRYVVRFKDRAGTETWTDDVVTYLGGASSADTATRLTVSTGRAKLAPDQEVEEAPEPDAERVWGGSAIGTALTASRESFEAGEATTAVIASGERWGEALASAGLAGAVDGPVLLTQRSKMSGSVLQELRRVGARKVYLVGSTSMIDRRQERLLRACGYSVERLSGADHYEVSARIAREIDSISEVTSRTPVFVVSGSSRTDAAVVGPAAYTQGAPVLYVKSTGTPSAVLSAARDLDLERGYLVGSAAALPVASYAALRTTGMGVMSLTRDASAYTRAAQVAEGSLRRGWLDLSGAGLTAYADTSGVTGAAAMLGREGAPLLFGTATSLPTATRSVLKAHAATIDSVDVLASPTAVKASVMVAAGSQ